MAGNANESPQDNQLKIAAYNQNWETFRSLNGLMWQIPIIAMTLTGGLWFGVSKVDNLSYFSAALLVLAFAGNIGLIFVLIRLRYIMGQYLSWGKAAYPDGHVAADGAGWLTSSNRVSHTFQCLLFLSAAISLGLFCQIMSQRTPSEASEATHRAISFYDRHAAALADSYESVPFSAAHPSLAQRLTGVPPLRVLDVGAGSGRDAAAIARLGHSVIAVEPSVKMLKLAKN